MLEGLKIIEYATYIAAPSAGGVLADWGADVTKIESIDGDPIRQFFATVGAELDGNPVFDLDNRGKKSVAIDTSKPDGAEILKKLVADADVFITNLRPGSLARAGLDWESLKTLNSKLVYASVSGYGLSGPDAERPGFDVTAFWSRAGVAQMTAIKGTEPMPIRTGVGDHTTGLATVSGILAALYERQTTGKGRLVETSLLRTGIYSVSSDMAIQLKFGKLASTRSRKEAVNPLANMFQASCDTWICIVPRQGNTDWPNLCRALERPELIDDERFLTSKTRRKHKSELVTELDRAFNSQPLEYWAKRMDAEDVAWAPVQHASQVVVDPQAEAAGAFVDTPAPDGTSFRAPATPVRFHGADDGPKGPPPNHGQHTQNVLSALGYSEDQVLELIENGVVKAG